MYLGLGEPKSTAVNAIALPQQLANLEPADWSQYLLAGLNTEDLISKVALLPQHSSSTAADALAAQDDAAALAAAEARLKAAAGAGGADGDAPGSSSGAAGAQQDPQELVKQCRQVLFDLVNLHTKKQGTGEQLAFFGPKMAEETRAPRPVDIKAVAARLEAGLYSSTGSCLEAMAADLEAAFDLWRACLGRHHAAAVPGGCHGCCNMSCCVLHVVSPAVRAAFRRVLVQQAGMQQMQPDDQAAASIVHV